MAHSDSYTEASPTDSTLATSIDDEIVKSRRMLRERFAVDHKISSSDAGADVFGVHKQVTFEARISTPTEPTNSIATFYLKTGDYDCEIRFVDERDVDNKIVIVGEVKMLLGSSVPGGWLALDGSTLGNAASGADYAGDDYKDLYYWLYAELADAQAAVSGGRTTVGPDWTANKTLTMPDGRARMPIGAGTDGVLTDRTIGDTSGDETKDVEHAHAGGAHTHTGTAHVHSLLGAVLYTDKSGTGTRIVYDEFKDYFMAEDTSPGIAGGYDISKFDGPNTASGGTGATGGATGNTGDAGSATQDVMNPWIAFTYIIKY